MAKKEKKSEIEKAFDKFLGEKIFGEEKKRGILMVFYDMEEESETSLVGTHIAGDFGTLVATITRGMEKNEKLRELIKESNSFYRYKNNPMDGIFDSLLNRMEDIFDKKKLENVRTQDAEAQDAN